MRVYIGESEGLCSLVSRLKTSPLVQFEKGAFSVVVAHAAEETEKRKNLLGVLCV